VLKNKLFYILSLLLICCQHSTDFDDFPEDGKTIVSIDNSQYAGSAYFSSRITENSNSISIILNLDDSTSIKISSKNFDEGIIFYNLYQDVIFFTLIDYRQYQPFYSGREGILNLKKVTSEQIIGEFKIVVEDGSSSCSDCPEKFKKTEGKFNAIKM
jgi:hypothetical protein